MQDVSRNGAPRGPSARTPRPERRSATTTFAGVTVAVACLLGSCTGEVGDLPASPRGPVVPPGPIVPNSCDPATHLAPATPLRRLTRDEYNHTVQHLLDVTARPADAFPADESLHGFAAGASVSPLQAELYGNAATDLVAALDVDAIAEASCPGAALDEACVRRVIADFGRRAYRRTVEPAQIDRLVTVFGVGVTDESPQEGLRMVLEAMLQSPYFVYRVELGAETTEPGRVALTPDELASRLSYLVWGTMPDDELFSAAETGALRTADDLTAHAERMLADERARDAMREFYIHWLELDFTGVTKDPARYPEFDDALVASMTHEAERLIDHVLWDSTGTLDELLTAPYTFVDERLAEVYGIEGVVGDEMVRVDLDPAQRAGLLMLPGVMARHARPEQSSPVLRGVFIRERVLCQSIAPPPADLIVVPPDPDPSLSTRQRFEQHRTDPSCSSCHRLMDPIGFGFENFDAIGAWRDTDEGFDVDATGEIIATEDANGTFDGAAEMVTRLAASSDVQSCVTRQWFRSTFGRTEATSDTCTLDEVGAAFEESGHDLRTLVLALVRTDAFRHRTITIEEAP
ncbi:MAG: DUF1592 domain-containing protein [Myxococcota bacterium]|nr:DUF1592 domain-containing protein [Myxococcota bacterium]